MGVWGPLGCMGLLWVYGAFQGVWGPYGYMGPLGCMGSLRVYGALQGVWGPLGCMGPFSLSSRSLFRDVCHFSSFAPIFHHEDGSSSMLCSVGNNLQTNGMVWSCVRRCQARIPTGPTTRLMSSVADLNPSHGQHLHTPLPLPSRSFPTHVSFHHSDLVNQTTTHSY